MHDVLVSESVCHPTDKAGARTDNAGNGGEMRIHIAFMAALVVAGLAMAACGENDPEPSSDPNDPIAEVKVGQLLEDPDAYNGATVLVREAAVVPIERSGGFVLESGENRILVYAPSGLPDLEAGEVIPVRGEVVRFTEPAADALGDELAGAPELERVATDRGDPYLLLRALPTVEDGAGG